MKVQQTQNKGQQKGSFGIPEEMMEQISKKKQSQEQENTQAEASTEEEPQKEGPEQADFFNGNESVNNKEGEVPPSARPPEENEEEESNRQTSFSDLSPDEIFEHLGVDFTDEDFQHLLFKGYVEKDITITKFKGKDFTARIKTLTTHEYDEIDEILTEELKNVSMSPNGYEARRSLLIGAYGVTHLMGKPLTKPIYFSQNHARAGELNTREMSLERRKVLRQLAPPVANRIIELHNALSLATNMIVREPGEYGKNS